MSKSNKVLSLLKFSACVILLTSDYNLTYSILFYMVSDVVAFEIPKNRTDL